MSDIVERLREDRADFRGERKEAADEIEHLRAHLRLLRNIAAHNDVLHPPSIVAHIDRVLAGEPSDAPVP